LRCAITQNELFVYGPALACVAHHQLLPRGKGGHSVLAAHRPPRLDSPGASLEIIREHFLALGEAAGDFLGGLVETHPRSAAYHARRILELPASATPRPDVAAAMAHALTFHAFSANAVARIVEVRARPRTLDEFVAAETESKLRGLGRIRRSDSEPTAAQMLFTLVDQRVGRTSTLMTSNIKLSGLGQLPR
jgi:hypothetical protein